jgi:hypothetical protein
MPSVEQLNLFRTRFYQVHGHAHGPERGGTYWVIPTMPVSGPRLPIRMYWMQNIGWFEIDENTGDIAEQSSTRALAMWIEETPEEKRKATSHGGNHIA